MAESRADEALKRIASGEKLLRREPKVAYNGAEGVPIREEVLSRHGEEVISRNAYGAHCLNSPRLLIADVDYDNPDSPREFWTVWAVVVVAAIVAGAWFASVKWALIAAFASLTLGFPLLSLLRWVLTAARGGKAVVARKRLTDFLATHADWNVRVYQTPAGLRLIATHRAFDPLEAEVHAFFSAVGADSLYVRMCKNQRCFRARLTAKPWRIGIGDHMRPRPGVWPVGDDKRARRDAWIAGYESLAGGFAACRYLESLGSGRSASELAPVVELHDNACRARLPGLKLA
ncbi:MAG: hypothetical protein SF172_16800 [Burkholderiales bacterium]|nr:hypothetical protein [Burkholderiales bacterium]